MFIRALKNISVSYRFALAVRRCLIPAVGQAFWRFYQALVGKLLAELYSTAALRRDSSLYAFLSDIRQGPPVKLFSIYQALRCGYPKIPGRILLEDQGKLEVVSGSMLAEATIQTHVEQPWPIFWSRHEQVHLVANSLALVTADKELCIESVYGFRYYHDDPAVTYFKLPPSVELKGNWTSVVSRWVPNDGSVPNHSHWLLEALPRLAFLKEFPADTRIIIPRKLAAYQRESLAMLGLKPEQLWSTPESHLEVEHYYFSAPPSMIAAYSPYAVKFLRDTFLPKADPAYQGPKRFFITRRNNARNLENNAELEQFFASIGWGVIDLCDLTFAQEIRLFSEAEAFCGVFGSGLTNALFCRPECAVIAVMHDYWTDSVTEWILKVVGTKRYSLKAYPADACRHCRVDIEGVRQQLKSVGEA